MAAHAAQGFAALLDAADGPLVLPGVGTPLEALAAVRAGSSGVYTSGCATAGWQSGGPDIGLTGLREVLDCRTAIRTRLPHPVLVDADTGHGDVSDVGESVPSCSAHLAEVGDSADREEPVLTLGAFGDLVGLPAHQLEETAVLEGATWAAS